MAYDGGMAKSNWYGITLMAPIYLQKNVDFVSSWFDFNRAGCTVVLTGP
jgi:hypothetical protein